MRGTWRSGVLFSVLVLAFVAPIPMMVQVCLAATAAFLSTLQVQARVVPATA